MFGLVLLALLGGALAGYIPPDPTATIQVVQPIDHGKPSKGTFNQKVLVCAEKPSAFVCFDCTQLTTHVPSF